MGWRSNTAQNSSTCSRVHGISTNFYASTAYNILQKTTVDCDSIQCKDNCPTIIHPLAASYLAAVIKYQSTLCCGIAINFQNLYRNDHGLFVANLSTVGVSNDLPLVQSRCQRQIEELQSGCRHPGSSSLRFGYLYMIKPTPSNSPETKISKRKWDTCNHVLNAQPSLLPITLPLSFSSPQPHYNLPYRTSSHNKDCRNCSKTHGE